MKHLLGRGVLLPCVLGLVMGTLLRGQQPASSVPPAEGSKGTLLPAAVKEAPAIAAKKHDLSRLSIQERNTYLAGQRCLDWLMRANKPDGRFVYGFLPALRAPMEGDDYVRQAGAAFALARGAKFYGEERAAAVAKQALLTLLLETTLDPQEKHLRYTAAHPQLVNRLEGAGMLVLAIHELPSPAEDLLQHADQLCYYLRSRLQDDGSLTWPTGEGDAKSSGTQADGVQHYPGPALYAIIRSQALRPAPWKLEALRKGRAYYDGEWKRNKNTAMVAWHTAAYAEAFVATREKAFADSVFEMNDWLCTLQYQQADPRRSQWIGGFMLFRDGRAQTVAPDVSSARVAESLVEACRVAKLAGDVQRHQRYKQALDSCLRFVTTLQYTEANAQHFAEWYRPALVGAFHASHQDGNLRLDYSQHALSALVRYLEHVAELP